MGAWACTSHPPVSRSWRRTQRSAAPLSPAGFGAHAYHWRYTIPALAKKHCVYSICLLGYGWSDKAVVEYSGETWAKQVRCKRPGFHWCVS